MAPACVSSSLSSTCVPVVTFDALAIALIRSLIFIRVSFVLCCYISMPPSNTDSVLIEAYI